MPLLDSARSSLASAARALDAFRDVSGAADGASASSPWRAPAESGARAALDEARARLVALEAEFARARLAAAAAAEESRSRMVEAEAKLEAQLAQASIGASAAALEIARMRESARVELAAVRSKALEDADEALAQARRFETAAREAEAGWSARLKILERDALSAARAQAQRELAEAKARAAALEADLETARGTAAALESEARALREAAQNRAASRSDSEANADAVRRRASEAASRVSLLEAECVRLEKLRLAADQAVADAEAQGRAVAESLRGELRVAHAALDRAAVEAGAAEAKTRAEVEPLLKRLEAATARVQALERERRLEQARGTGESSATATELLRAQAVSASLRQEASDARRQAAEAQAALERTVSARPAELDRALAAAQAASAQFAALQTDLLGAQGAAAALRQELADARRQTAETKAALERTVSGRPAELERALAVAQAASVQLAAQQTEQLVAQEAAAALRQELADARSAAAREKDELRRRSAESLSALERTLAERTAEIERAWTAAREEGALRRRAAEAQMALERTLAERTAELEKASAETQAASARLPALELELTNAREVSASLRQELADARAAAAPLPPQEEYSPKVAPSAEEPVAAAPFVSPALEPVLDPGWARLVRLIRPPTEAAYAHLRRLSTLPLKAGQQTLLRMAAASIAQATDALTSVELALEEGPAPGPATAALPALEASIAAWEAPFRRGGVALAHEWAGSLPDAAHDDKALRVLLHHALRNVLEAVPRGGRLTVRASRGPDGGLRVEFVDDGPGFPAEWLERRFEPFAAPRHGRAGLGLSLVRRTLRRWGGDAEASNGPSGRGARLTMTFAPPRRIAI
jgi:chromosome segregation ATPase